MCYFLTAGMGILLVSLFNNANNSTFTNSQINANIVNVQGRTGEFGASVVESSAYDYL